MRGECPGAEVGVSRAHSSVLGTEEEGRRGPGEHANVCRVSVGLGPAHFPPPPSGKLAFQHFLHPGLAFLGLWAAWVRLADGKRRALWAKDLTLAAAVSTSLLASFHFFFFGSLACP